MRKGNISIFVPHIGCPHQCSFCNQNIITGKNTAPSPAFVKKTVERALENKNFVYEIAFFGGSFTAIDRNYMISLLEAAYSYVNEAAIIGIRVSTRPDCIDEDILSVLKSYGVTSIELGAQSMNNDVLLKNMRGHTAEDVKKASALIKNAGFELGLQMMTGLYGSSDELDIGTAEEIISLKPDTVRIYPTVVLKNTYLERLYSSGRYLPNGVKESVDICAEIVPMFKENGIKVIRLGLHASDDIEKDMLAGGYHESLGELVASKIMLKKVLEYPPDNYVVYINERSRSKMAGNKRANLTELSSKGYNISLKIDNTIKPDELKIVPGKIQ